MSQFIDAPIGQRCEAVITLKDGSTAQCGRYGKVDSLCRQHAKIASSRATIGNVEAALWRYPSTYTNSPIPADLATLAPSKCIGKGWCIVDHSGQSVSMDGMTTVFRFKRDATAFLAQLAPLTAQQEGK